MKTYENDIDDALDLYKHGKVKESAGILSEVCDRIPSSDGTALILAGSLLRDAGEFSKAVYCFEIAIRSDSLSSRASLGLFHSLWRDGRHLLGLDELERFYSVSNEQDKLDELNDDGEHNRLLEELADSYFEKGEERPTDPLVVIQKLRRLFES